MRARNHGDHAAWVEAQLHPFVEDSALFNEARQPVPTQLAVALRLSAPRIEAVPVHQGGATIENSGELAAIEHEVRGRAVRKRFRRNEIAATDFCRADADLARGGIEQAFGYVHRLRS